MGVGKFLSLDRTDLSRWIRYDMTLIKIKNLIDSTI